MQGSQSHGKSEIAMEKFVVMEKSWEIRKISKAMENKKFYPIHIRNIGLRGQIILFQIPFGPSR